MAEVKGIGKGTLLVSLDFELFWGVQDCHTYDDYGQNVLGGRKAVPRLLEILKKHNIHCSWATVGMMFAENKQELIDYSPSEALRPHYENTVLSSYRILDDIGDNEAEEPYFYGKSLIDLIAKYPNQEIASHTYSHYYARENGQNLEEFKDVLSRENAETFAFSCGDVFGEYGIVGFIQYAVENNCIRFTEFAMSCRVAGKFIESALFVHLLEKESVDKGIFNVRETKKNSLLRRTLEGIGFINSGSDNRVINYVFNKSLKNSNLVKIEER